MDRFTEKFQPEPADIALCGSMAHKEQWIEVMNQIQDAGLNVHTPDLSEKLNWDELSGEEVIEKKNYFIERHLANIAVAKVVLVCNYEKNGEQGYIGTNVLMEMMAAYVYGKPIYLLDDIDAEGKGREILALKPKILHGNVNELIEIMKEKK